MIIIYIEIFANSIERFFLRKVFVPDVGLEYGDSAMDWCGVYGLSCVVSLLCGDFTMGVMAELSSVHELGRDTAAVFIALQFFDFFGCSFTVYPLEFLRILSTIPHSFG